MWCPTEEAARANIARFAFDDDLPGHLLTEANRPAETQSEEWEQTCTTLIGAGGLHKFIYGLHRLAAGDDDLLAVYPESGVGGKEDSDTGNVVGLPNPAKRSRFQEKVVKRFR